MSSIPEFILNLTPAEKLQLVEDLWDHLASSPENVPVHAWQIEELERRRMRLEAAPETAVKWEEILARLREKFG